SAIAPGPTPGTRGGGAKLQAVCWNQTISLDAGADHKAATNRPPGLSTREISRAAAARSITYIRLNDARTTSKVAASAGIASARPSLKSTLWRFKSAVVCLACL